jgi:hypothetical protein
LNEKLPKPAIVPGTWAVKSAVASEIALLSNRLSLLFEETSFYSMTGFLIMILPPPAIEGFFEATALLSLLPKLDKFQNAYCARKHLGDGTECHQGSAGEVALSSSIVFQVLQSLP